MTPAFVRSARESRELRASLTELATQLGDAGPRIVWYFDHWLDNGRRRWSAMAERVARAAVNIGGGRGSAIEGDNLVVSGRNWRSTLARSEPHYAYFEDVADAGTGVHLEITGADVGPSSPMGTWLARRGWAAHPLRRVLDPRLLPAAEREATQLGARIKRVDTPFRDDLAYFCRAALAYCIWLERSFARLESRVGRVWLTGETSWPGRAAIRALRGRVPIVARQHGAVLPTQLDYLHDGGDASDRGAPVPDEMWLYDDHYRAAFGWMQEGGTSLQVWRDPRIFGTSAPVDRSGHGRAVYVSQPLAEPWAGRASAMAQRVASERGLPLHTRRHPSERGAPNGSSLADDVLGSALVITVFSTVALEAACAGIDIALLQLGECDVRAAFPPDLPIAVVHDA